MRYWTDRCVMSSRKKYGNRYPGDTYMVEADAELQRRRRQHNKFLINEELQEYWNNAKTKQGEAQEAAQETV